MIIEDLEFEKSGRYVRISISDELTDEEYQRIYSFLHSVVHKKVVPEIVKSDS